MRPRSRKHVSSGATLIEILVAVFIMTLILMGFGYFERSMFRSSISIQSTLRSQGQVRTAFRKMVSEIRSALPAWNGAHIIDTAGSTTLVFYTTVDNDQYTERVRYQYMLNGTIPRGESHFDLTTNTYDLPETTSTIVTGVSLPPSGRIFSYYDTNYDGTANYPILPDPVDISKIRLIRIDMPVTTFGFATNTAKTYTTEVSFRNLKDNY